MSPEDIASRFAASRTGLTLVDFVDVGLPCWRILARCEILAKKNLSAIDETILHTLALGFEDVTEIQVILGLDEIVLETAVTGLVGQGWATGSKEDGVALTEAGKEKLVAAAEIVSRETVIPLDYDGLRRTPIYDDSLIDHKRGTDMGFRAIPPMPNRKPDVAELRICRHEIATILTRTGDGRDQESQLLEIRSIDRRDRYLLPATALVFAPNTGGKCEVAFVVDGKESSEHEAAFQNAGLLASFGLDRDLRGLKKRPLQLKTPSGTAGSLDLDSEAQARAEIRRLEADSTSTTNNVEDLRSAKNKLARINPRTVEPAEHPSLLKIAIGMSSKRLMIVGGRVSAAALDAQTQRTLRKTLEAGTLVHIAFENDISSDPAGEESLRKIASEFPNLRLVESKLPIPECVLLSDSRFMVTGSFPWFGYKGDPSRAISDRRSIFQKDYDLLNAKWMSVDGRDTENAGSSRKAKRPRRRRGRRGGKTRPKSS